MLKWHNYPQEKPDYKHYGKCFCKLDNGEFRALYYDSVYGWCDEFDDFDYPHFIYDWYLQWVENTPENEKEWEKLKEQRELELWEKSQAAYRANKEKRKKKKRKHNDEDDDYWGIIDEYEDEW